MTAAIYSVLALIDFGLAALNVESGNYGPAVFVFGAAFVLLALMLKERP